MSSSFKRTDRIAELMQRTLAQLIQQDIKIIDGVPIFITISAVKVSRDLSHANVYFTVFNQDPAEAKLALTTAATYLRTALAKTMTLRTVPQLHFIYDESIEYGKRLSRLIDDVNEIDSDDEPS